MAQKSQSHEMGMHTEQLGGRTQQRFFEPAEAENFVYPDAVDVDFNKRTELDAGKLSSKDINLKIRELMAQGYGNIVVKNPGAKHRSEEHTSELQSLMRISYAVFCL